MKTAYLPKTCATPICKPVIQTKHHFELSVARDVGFASVKQSFDPFISNTAGCAVEQIDSSKLAKGTSPP